MSGPFEIVEGDDDAVCVDGVCAMPAQPMPAEDDSARA